jgi:hypothetical protein
MRAQQITAQLFGARIRLDLYQQEPSRFVIVAAPGRVICARRSVAFMLPAFIAAEAEHCGGELGVSAWLWLVNHSAPSGTTVMPGSRCRNRP